MQKQLPFKSLELLKPKLDAAGAFTLAQPVKEGDQTLGERRERTLDRRRESLSGGQWEVLNRKARSLLSGMTCFLIFNAK